MMQGTSPPARFRYPADTPTRCGEVLETDGRLPVDAILKQGHLNTDAAPGCCDQRIKQHGLGYPCDGGNDAAPGLVDLPGDGFANLRKMRFNFHWRMTERSQ